MKPSNNWRVALVCALSFLSLFPARAQEASDYKIAPQDIIIVEVYDEKDLSRELRVSGKGEISFPLLDNVPVAGKTPAEVEEILENLLEKDFLVDPHVNVVVKSYRIRTVSVLGAVNKPGAVELPGEDKLTIIEAIARAGGLAKLASDKKIDFTRDGETKRYSWDQLKKLTDPDKVIYLQPGDIINIHETTF